MFIKLYSHGQRILIRFMLCIAFCSFAPVTFASDTQFIVVNLQASEINSETFQQIAVLDSRNGDVRVGVATIFSYFNGPHDIVRENIERFLQLSQKFKIPVVVQLDGEQWWGNRPDLWNWWDADKPGYDPENRMNVEWIGWSADYAMKIAWRNWGQQIRVLPPPNLMSPKYREACDIEMRRLVPVIMDWWNALVEEDKDLLIALKLGWESSIGVNAFYYPDGNRLRDLPVAQDPTYGLISSQLPGRGVVATGYAAINTLELASDGKIKEAHQVAVVQRHLEDLCRVASELGVPRERLFTHVGGWKDGELLYDAALNPYASPGWSFYKHARDPKKSRGMLRGRKASDAQTWGAVEWFPQGATTQADWQEAMANTFAVPGCRYLCIYNWNSIATDDNALGAIKFLCRE